MISQTQMKTICRSMFEDWNQLIIISSDNPPAAHVLNDNHTNVWPSVKTCGMAPICTVNTQTQMSFCTSASDLYHRDITAEAAECFSLQSVFVFVCFLNKSSWRPRAPSATHCFHVIYCRLLPLLSLSRSSLFFFFCDLEQSALQLFKELSNPGLDGSRAWRHNRILALTLMTAPPAVAEPAVGSQEEYIVGGGVASEREVAVRERLTESLSVMPLVRCGITEEATRRKCFTFGRLPL